MELIPSDRFLTWAKSHEIAPDARYDEPRCLVYVPNRDIKRFWLKPERGTAWPRFLYAILGGVRKWSGGYFWPRGGQTRYGGNSGWPETALRRAAFKLIGIPDGFAGAVRFEQTEFGELQTLLFTYLAAASHVGDDVFVVPEHGDQMVWLDHHDVVHVSFREEDFVAPFVARMAKGGFQLPTALPDETFKRQSWMKG